MEGPSPRRDADPVERRRAVVEAGHRHDKAVVDAARDDPDPAVRAACLGALERLGALGVDDLATALADPAPIVRRRAAVLAARARGTGSRSRLPSLLVEALDDPDPIVAESAAWAIGERRPAGAVDALSAMAAAHADARCRESAIAALGAIGAPSGLKAVLDALDDRPPVRRRAVVALAGFEGAEVEAALARCLEDPDWQVRQAAEVLLER
ncbi:MAG: HEAT repeat domain-containing protein [Acidimicrobiales bacterium]